jgi:hypothetical protein
VHKLTPYEEEAQKQSAKWDVENANAAAAGANKASAAGTEAEAKDREKARGQLPALQPQVAIFKDQINRLLSDPNLGKIAGGKTLVSQFSDDRVGSEMGAYLLAHKDEQALLNLWSQIKANAAMQGLSQFRGTGARITNKEFTTDASAMAGLSRNQDLNTFKAELARMRDHAQLKLDDASDWANGPTQRAQVTGMTGGTGAAPAPAAPPATGAIDVSALVQKWGS